VKDEVGEEAPAADVAKTENGSAKTDDTVKPAEKTSSRDRKEEEKKEEEVVSPITNRPTAFSVVLPSRTKIPRELITD